MDFLKKLRFEVIFGTISGPTRENFPSGFDQNFLFSYWVESVLFFAY
jgi:hypothetical protein